MPQQLVVYENREATQPLPVGLQIGSRGNTEQTALIVVVPQRRSGSSRISVDGVNVLLTKRMRVNPPALVAFWEALVQILPRSKLMNWLRYHEERNFLEFCHLSPIFYVLAIRSYGRFVWM